MSVYRQDRLRFKIELIIMSAMDLTVYLLWLVAAAAVFFLTVAAIDGHRFVIREYRITSAKVSRRLTFVFVSDLHGKDYGNRNAALVKAIDEIHPDAVLIGGDLIVSRTAAEDRKEWLGTSLAFARSLARLCPVFFTNGNHESQLYWDECFHPQYRRLMRGLRNAGVVMLHNRSVDFKGIRISGLELPKEGYRKIFPSRLEPSCVEEALGPSDPSVFELLLTHNPKFFPFYADWGADLVLAGHVHGGIMRIGRLGMISPDYRLFPKYSGGLYRYPEKGTPDQHPDGAPARMVLSCGIGEHTLPLRIFNPAELGVIYLEPEHLSSGMEEYGTGN